MTVGAIAAGDVATAEAGAAMLRAGGNAVDAVCAAACMAFVSEAPLCGPVGGGVLLVGPPGAAAVLDFFAVVPGRGAAKPSALDFHGIDVDFGPTVQQFHMGRAAAAVPGTLLGLLEAHRRHGRVPWSTLVQPATEAARRGHRPSAQLCTVAGMLRPILAHEPATRALFFDERGEPSFANPRMADLLEAIGDDGEAVLRGPIARAIAEAFGPDHGGLLTAEDLARYAPVWRQPLRLETGDHTLLTNPPPSSGGSLVALGLRLASGRPLAELPWLGPQYMGELAAVLGSVDHAKLQSRQRPGEPLGEALIEDTHRVHQQQRQRRNLGSTTHISVLDGDGTIASLTMSNGEGCGHTVAEYGLHLNNFLGEEDINPQGFHRQAPGTWMSTMMSPSAVLHRGRPALVLGTGGSNRIRSALLLTMLHRLARGRALEEAVVAPRMHVEGEQLWFEHAELGDDTVQALRDTWPGAIAFSGRNMFFGGVHAVAMDDAAPYGVGDARRGGAVRTVG